MFSIANGHEYCTALLKTTCCFSQSTPPSENSNPMHLHSITNHTPSSHHHHPAHSSTPTAQPTHASHMINQRAANSEVTLDAATARNEPPRSQGIAIEGGPVPRRRSLVKRSSLASSGLGSFNPFGTSEGKFGSFMRGAAVTNTPPYGSSVNSWSICDASSVDGGSHAPPGSSFRSWFWVNKPDGSDQSGV